MKHPSKNIFNQACELYSSICSQPDNDSLVSSLNNLLQEYDFDNEIFTEDGKQGVALCTGEVIIPAEYQRIKLISRLSLPREEIKAIGVDKEGAECLIDSTGNVIFSADEIKPESEAFLPFAFRKGDRWGVVGGNAKIVIPPVMDYIEWPGNDYIFFQQAGKYGLRTPFGEMVAPKFDSIGWDYDNFLLVEFKGNKGYLDENLKFTTDESEAYYDFEIIDI